MTHITKIDHIEQAKELMLSQFEDSPDIHSLEQSWLTPLQNMENELIDFLEGSGITNAKGVMLDIIGTRMGVDRQGRLDLEYRTAILGRALASSMDGTTERFYEGFRVLINSNLAHCFTYYPNDLYAVAGEGYSPALAQELENIVQAGTRVHLMVVNDLDYVTVAIRDADENVLENELGAPYEVLIDGQLYPLTTSVSAGAETYGTETTFGWEGVELPNQANCAFEATPYRVVEGLIVDGSGNQLVDNLNNPITFTQYSEI